MRQRKYQDIFCEFPMLSIAYYWAGGSHRNFRVLTVLGYSEIGEMAPQSVAEIRNEEKE